jgi:hypothetical protein
MKHFVASSLVALALLSHPSNAEESGNAFCAKLRKATTPESGAIYYEESGGRIVRLEDGHSLQRRDWDFFYFRKRSDDASGQPGAVIVKIVYAASGPEFDNVSLFNNGKKVASGCKASSIARYERFHGRSAERNACIRSTFHQGGGDAFNTLDPVERRREFLFGAPGIDTRSFDAAALELMSAVFQNLYGPEHRKGNDQNANEATRGNSYRSMILNYSGQDKDGSCIRFAPVFQPNYTAATFSITDMIERDGVPLRDQVKVSIAAAPPAR